MKYKVKYSKNSTEDLKKLDKKENRRVAKKIQYFSEQKNPLYYGTKLIGLENKYRWRIGKWRVLFETNPKTNKLTILWILAIQKRDKVYIRLK